MESLKNYFIAPGIKTIEDKAAEIWEIEKDLLYKQTRKREVVDARNVLMDYYCTKFSKEGKENSEKESTKIFNKNRSTIYHARNTIKALLNSDKSFTEKYNLFYQTV